MGCKASFFFEVVSFQTANRPATGLSPGLCSGPRAGETGFRGVQTQSKAGFSPVFFTGLGWFYRGSKTTVKLAAGGAAPMHTTLTVAMKSTAWVLEC